MTTIKSALVTGGGSGIGLAIADVLSQNGFRVVIAGRDKEKLDKAAAELGKNPGTIHPVVCDVSRPEEVDRLFQSENLATLHVLVNNAGISTFAPIAETSLEMWERHLAINLTGTFLVTRAAIPLLKKNGGHIFNIISIAGKKGFPNCGAYGASKFGLHGFTEVLREEMRPWGIKVTAILPGAIDTPIFDGQGETWDREKMARPSDIAAILWQTLNLSPQALAEEIVIGPASGPF